MDTLLELPEEKELNSRIFSRLVKQVVGTVEDNQQSLRTTVSYKLFKELTTKFQENEVSHIKQAIQLLNVDISNTSIAELLSQLQQGIGFVLKVGCLIGQQCDQ